MRFVSSILVFICLGFSSQNYAATAQRSDTLDIRKTIIHFNITDFGSKIIFGHATLGIKSKMNNVSTILLDLEGLSVDSVHVNGAITTYTHNGMNLSVNTLTPLAVNDSVTVDVFYHGVPIADAQWGGFSYVGNYAFQMGVGFNAQPHSFGRTWHPCFDNFVERSPYEFFITTNNTMLGISNGFFIDSVHHTNNTITWHWKLDQEIPSYLAAVAVSNYIMIDKTLSGLNGTTPATLTCQHQDSLKVEGSFSHLQKSFDMLEHRFGAHSFPKVGYTLVPFNYGAMEHATNIHIGTPFIDGTLNYETLIAHELSHHWWGDLVTCASAGDMWLNEGFASYCELLHQEHTYGKSAYMMDMRQNHFDVINRAHITDQGYRAVANMDSLFTYGATVYSKGSDMIHTMRAYLGDSLFFDGLTAFLNAHKWQAISSPQLRDFLSQHTGVNMNDFFNDWIFQPGFAHFSIDSISKSQNGNEWDVSVFIRHRKHQATNYYSNVPLEIGFYDQDFNVQTFKALINSRCTEFKVKLNFEPKITALDPHSKISDAITEDTKFIKFPVVYDMPHAKCKLVVKNNSNTDSSMIRAEHHWVAPDRFKSPANANGYVINNSRYWNIDIVNQGFDGLLNFSYSASSANSFLDSSWIKNTDDSIRMFYREDARSEWQLANDSLRPGVLTDKIGQIFVKDPKSGQYCFGIKRSNFIDNTQSEVGTAPCAVLTNVVSHQKPSLPYSMYPNPTTNELWIKWTQEWEPKVLRLYSMDGKLLLEQRLTQREEKIVLPSLNNGIYLVDINGVTQRLAILN